MPEQQRQPLYISPIVNSSRYHMQSVHDTLLYILYASMYEMPSSQSRIRNTVQQAYSIQEN